jgi:hypothetical protein
MLCCAVPADQQVQQLQDAGCTVQEHIRAAMQLTADPDFQVGCCVPHACVPTIQHSDCTCTCIQLPLHTVALGQNRVVSWQLPGFSAVRTAANFVCVVVLPLTTL